MDLSDLDWDWSWLHSLSRIVRGEVEPVSSSRLQDSSDIPEVACAWFTLTNRSGVALGISQREALSTVHCDAVRRRHVSFPDHRLDLIGCI
jgi:hypothetical protein